MSEQPPTPKVDALSRLRRIFTTEQLQQIAEACEQVQAIGHGEVTMYFINGVPRYYAPHPSMEFKKP